MTGNLPYAKQYQDLIAYQKSMELANQVFHETRSFPKEEVYSRTDQIRRASRSVGAQLAEAWGKRNYKKHFISKLTDASAELNETEHWLNIAHNCSYISTTTRNEIIDLCAEINRLINGMKSKAELFCLSE